MCGRANRRGMFPTANASSRFSRRLSKSNEGRPWAPSALVRPRDREARTLPARLRYTLIRVRLAISANQTVVLTG